jgi:hypothetical protein
VSDFTAVLLLIAVGVGLAMVAIGLLGRKLDRTFEEDEEEDD